MYFPSPLLSIRAMQVYYLKDLLYFPSFEQFFFALLSPNRFCPCSGPHESTSTCVLLGMSICEPCLDVSLFMQCSVELLLHCLLSSFCVYFLFLVERDLIGVFQSENSNTTSPSQGQGISVSRDYISQSRSEEMSFVLSCKQGSTFWRIGEWSSVAFGLITKLCTTTSHTGIRAFTNSAMAMPKVSRFGKRSRIFPLVLVAETDVSSTHCKSTALSRNEGECKRVSPHSLSL